MTTLRVLGFVAAVFLFGCSYQEDTTVQEEEVQAEASRFSTLDLKVGMRREQVEEQVAVLLDKQKTYSPYGNNLRGGTVEYRDGAWILRVNYKAGVTAPWVQNSDGTVEHLPPVDETVIEYEIERIPNRKK